MVETPEKLEKIIKGEIPVICDFYSCEMRGGKPRCYLDIYKLCAGFVSHKETMKQLEIDWKRITKLERR